MSEYLPILIAIGALALLPFVALMVTSFAKIVIVLGLLRQALGLQQVPPNMVLNGIALVLTVYVMAPVVMEASDRLRAEGHGLSSFKTVDDIGVGYDAVATPLRAFLQKHAEARDRKFFLRTAARLWPEERARNLKEDDMLVLVPAFTVTELGEAFRIGFVLFVAFLIIDLVVANILLALGMSMVSPTIISVPFKLLLFVMLDGWARLLQGLVLGYQ
ncbi:type III secretion system export apparatus subunit SctR [Piscinibacter terrae]|uniref:type III secretion system export apparatus subunit SctR n=1 Tax=Piscinibacter terrae TaxID=2496871 RepID=UPI00268A0DF4